VQTIITNKLYLIIEAYNALFKHLLKYLNRVTFAYNISGMEEENACIRVFADKEHLNQCAKSLESVEESIQRLNQVLSLAGSETRLKLLYLLEQKGELCVCDLSDVLGMTMPAVSQQLRKLKDGNIIQSKKVGQTIFYSLKQQHLEIIRPLFQYINNKTANNPEKVS
jgi:ArsR family transcriptional regulator, lead/cadmium/zinc/bismuth-responsive transcriptional repressor